MMLISQYTLGKQFNSTGTDKSVLYKLFAVINIGNERSDVNGHHNTTGTTSHHFSSE